MVEKKKRLTESEELKLKKEAARIREMAKKTLGKDYIEDLPLPLTEAMLMKELQSIDLTSC